MNYVVFKASTIEASSEVAYARKLARVERSLGRFLAVIILISNPCLIAEGYTNAQPGDRVGPLELVQRDILISNLGNDTSDQLHYPWL